VTSAADTTALVVSARCPACGAPLDFSEGSNAIRCNHCGSNLLATGRGQTLSYTVSPRVSGTDARSIARFSAQASAPDARLGEPGLCFLPYYRFTATEIRLQRRSGDGSVHDAGDGSRSLGGLLALTSSAECPPDLARRLTSRREREPMELAGRRIERSILAFTGGIGAPSLGIRSSVARLELFSADSLPWDASVAPDDLGRTEAVRIALAPTGDEEIVARAVVSRILSLLHFPLWVVRQESRSQARLVVVDGLSGALVTSDGDPRALERMRAPGGHGRPTVGFRSLTCPNCGWDLAVEPLAVVFPCAGCDRAWLLDGHDLTPQATGVVEAPSGIGRDGIDYRPFWRIDGADAPPVPAGAPQDGQRSGAWLVPAFQHPNAKRLRDLAVRLSRRLPSFVEITAGGDRLALRGCDLDADDAEAMARVFAVAATAGRRGPTNLVHSASRPGWDDRVVPRTRLLWLPFVRDAYGWREPLTGTALPPRLAA
jgi:DNA-directed RNA polymerase subunit RPC12/RpoP